MKHFLKKLLLTFKKYISGSRISIFDTLKKEGKDQQYIYIYIYIYICVCVFKEMKENSN
jgi:hypothetical protein